MFQKSSGDRGLSHEHLKAQCEERLTLSQLSPWQTPGVCVGSWDYLPEAPMRHIFTFLLINDGAFSSLSMEHMQGPLVA